MSGPSATVRAGRARVLRALRGGSEVRALPSRAKMLSEKLGGPDTLAFPTFHLPVLVSLGSVRWP